MKFIEDRNITGFIDPNDRKELVKNYLVSQDFFTSSSGYADYSVDINENSLTELTRDLRSSNDFKIPKNFTTYPIDFGSKIFYKIFKNHGPFEIISNFAAHKHVRSEKDIYSIEAMIDNNFFKAFNFLEFLTNYPLGINPLNINI